MSTNKDQKLPVVPAGQPEQPYFPPPPPGPPPSQNPQVYHPQTYAPQHPNETPIPDYKIPQYDPAHPHFAPPPNIVGPEDDLYDATPTEEHAPPFPPRPSSSGHQDEHAESKRASWGHKFAGWGSKAAAPFNALANKMGSEAFLPTTLDKECDKAARILRSFAKDGIYSDAVQQNPSSQSATTGTAPTTDIPAAEKPTEVAKSKKPRALLTIPSKVISRAQGLAIFTTARAGFQVSGATGSGVLIARLPDGSWSPPSGIQVHSVGAGFVIGIDIYDCVVVINTKEALAAFTQTRMSLGSDLAVTAGPYGAGGALDFGMPQGSSRSSKDKSTSADHPHPATLAPPSTAEQQQPQGPTGPEGTATAAVPTSTSTSTGPGSSKIRKPSPFREVIKNPVYSYVKSRGFYAGVQIDGTVVTERKDANAAFYGAPVSVAQIIRGEVPAQGPAGMWPAGAKGLFDVLKGAEGWRGQQGPPSPLGHPGPTAATNTGTGTGTGVPFAPPPHAGVPTGYSPVPPTPAPAAGGVPGVVAGVQGLHIGGAGSSSAGHSAAVGGAPAPAPAPGTSAAAEAKAAEAAAEAAAHYYSSSYNAPPPSYADHTGGEELPPTYVDDGQYRPPADGKTGH